MIKGLYEAHLPVSNIKNSVEFYQKIGLELKVEDDDVAFMWIVPQRSLLGLWKHDISDEREPGSYPPNGRHVAFEIDFEDIRQAESWLKECGISVVQHGKLPSSEPYVRPHMKNASVYFDDPDGNNLEFICNLPDGPSESAQLIHLSQWNEL
ncbi:extradiol dioxygenase [Alicyclobacillus acidoterrestris]|uniref:VOC family protein n=1 Tax=Alicyclobacillus suci TaxID=2816080 RepID=UPI001190641F|nr:VOC family protein [Alicyclobacillus suci]GEO28106.1 extradiol dioxygenase [Alicyclobacillus acidoterrestris]